MVLACVGIMFAFISELQFSFNTCANLVQLKPEVKVFLIKEYAVSIDEVSDS